MLHTIETIQKLPITKDEAWEFLSSPINLATITPDSMGFKIISGFNAGEKMYPGMIIEYIVKPILGIPLHWVSEITYIQEKEYFIDEQRFGPYTFWHHTHFIKEINGGVEMRDVMHYKLPLGFVGRWMNTLFVQSQLKKIFNYREKKLAKLFGDFPN